MYRCNPKNTISTGPYSKSSRSVRAKTWWGESFGPPQYKSVIDTQKRGGTQKPSIYVLIEFLEPKNYVKFACIPALWIVEWKIANELPEKFINQNAVVVYYPDQSGVDLTKVEELARKKSKPEGNWNIYRAIVRGTAGSYDEAMRLMKNWQRLSTYAAPLSTATNQRKNVAVSHTSSEVINSNTTIKFFSNPSGGGCMIDNSARIDSIDTMEYTASPGSSVNGVTSCQAPRFVHPSNTYERPHTCNIFLLETLAELKTLYKQFEMFNWQSKFAWIEFNSLSAKLVALHRRIELSNFGNGYNAPAPEDEEEFNQLIKVYLRS